MPLCVCSFCTRSFGKSAVASSKLFSSLGIKLPRTCLGYWLFWRHVPHHQVCKVCCTVFFFSLCLSSASLVTTPRGSLAGRNSLYAGSPAHCVLFSFLRATVLSLLHWRGGYYPAAFFFQYTSLTGQDGGAIVTRGSGGTF